MKKTMVRKDMKELIISKELLSEVLDIKLEDIVDFKMFMNELFYYQELLLRANCQGKISKHKDSTQQSINIYEFAYKCKEWAFKRGYEIVVLANSIKIYKNHFEVYNTNTKLYDLDMFFRACNWIL